MFAVLNLRFSSAVDTILVPSVISKGKAVAGDKQHRMRVAYAPIAIRVSTNPKSKGTTWWR